MKHIWKDFLCFSAREKIACITLVIILIVFIFIYLLCSDLMDVSPTSLTEQETIRKEFAEYESSLESKQLISNESTQNLIEEDINDTLIVKLSKSRNTNSKVNNKLTECQTIDINVANESTFIKVPGIGKATAQKIIEYRKLLGGYSNLEQLQEIQGISNNKFIKLLPYLTLQKKNKVIFFYQSNLQILQNHPYINEGQLKLLKKLKEDNEISNIEYLSQYYQFKQSDIDRLSSYLDFTK